MRHFVAFFGVLRCFAAFCGALAISFPCSTKYLGGGGQTPAPFSGRLNIIVPKWGQWPRFPPENIFSGFFQSKRVSAPRETTGLTPAKKKHMNMTCLASSLKTRTHCASSLKTQSAIQEALATELTLLHVDNSSNLHCMTIITPNGNKAANGLPKDSDDDDYHPNSIVPLPLKQHKKMVQVSETKLVVDRKFMCFLQPNTFDNQPFRRGKQEMYSIEQMDRFDANFRKQLHFNFSTTQTT